MHILSDFVLAAAMYACTTPPVVEVTDIGERPLWGSLTDEEKKPYVEAARFLHSYLGGGALNQHKPEHLAKVLDEGLLKGHVASSLPAARTYLHMATTLFDDVR